MAALSHVDRLEPLRPADYAGACRTASLMPAVRIQASSLIELSPFFTLQHFRQYTTPSNSTHA